MVGWLVNNKLLSTWKEMAITQQGTVLLFYLPNHQCLEWLVPRIRFEIRAPKYETAILTT
jgi:hypothetical protein